MIRLKLTGTVAALLLVANMAAAQETPKPTDPQIAHIAYTASEIDISSARLALKASKNPDVRSFADDMVRDHTAVNKKALALLKKLKVKPEDNDTSRGLLKQARSAEARLGHLKGAAFDRAYIENEISYHKTVNDALRDALIPSASNGELKDFLSTGLKIFEGHQQHAEQLSQKLR